jgi:hypothetical protein
MRAKKLLSHHERGNVMPGEKAPVQGKEAPEKVVVPPSADEEIAYQLLRAPHATTGNLQELYSNHDEKSHVDIVEYDTERPAANVLYMSELLIGNQNSAVDFYLDTIERVKNLPEEMKPDLIVLSGLLQGDFKLLEKRRRSTLVAGLDGMDVQFRYAREMIEKAQEIGVPVIYNMSNDDRRIAEEYTIEIFRQMEKDSKGYEKKSKAIPSGDTGRENVVLNVSQLDKLRQHPLWQKHLQFQIETVFPYCLQSGRRLYTGNEMSARTKNKIGAQEYYVLFDAEERRKNGEDLLPFQKSYLKAAHKNFVKDLIITDDFNLELKTEGKEYHDWVRHNLGFSSQPMYQAHMKNGIDALSQLAVNGQETPNMLVTQHQQEDVGVGMQNNWIVSTAGLIDVKKHLSTKGSRTDANGDVSSRLVRTRRRTPSPGATSYERTDDGRLIVTYFNEALTEKSESIKERITIAELCDFQTGSITARPDLLVMYLDYIRVRSMGENATALFFGGDMMHGRNYPHFASESQQTGLMSMDSQEDFNISLFQEAFAGVSAEELKSLERILVQPGNHEWNSGTLKWHGYSFVSYMRHFFEKMLARGGYSDAEISKIVKTHDAVITPKGEYASGYTGIEYFGDMGVLIQHYLLERGGKGTGGELPVYQTQSFAAGGGDLMKNIDIFMAGHWHHAQWAVLGDKLGVVGGSMAGLSDYELKRAYRPTPSGTAIHIGGGLPVQLEVISEEALRAHKIQKGGYTEVQLEEEGYRTDDGFDVVKHGIWLPDSFPKSALQKKLRQQTRDASQRADSIAIIR